jgi:hypothetical protein
MLGSSSGDGIELSDVTADLRLVVGAKKYRGSQLAAGCRARSVPSDIVDFAGREEIVEQVESALLIDER